MSKTTTKKVDPLEEPSHPGNLKLRVYLKSGKVLHKTLEQTTHVARDLAALGVDPGDIEKVENAATDTELFL